MTKERKYISESVFVAIVLLLGLQIYTMPNRAKQYMEREGYTNVEVQSLFWNLTDNDYCVDEDLPFAFSATKGTQQFKGNICCTTYFLIFEDYHSKNVTLNNSSKKYLPGLD